MISTLRKLFYVSRPISWINTAFPFAAGYIVVSGSYDSVLFIGSLFFLIPYNLLMYGINDVYDYESDMKNPRKNSIEGALEAREFHPTILWSSSLLALPFVGYLLYKNPDPLDVMTLLAVVFFVIAYSLRGLRFKEIPLLDSMTSSLHFVGPLIYALVITDASFVVAWPYILAFFFWGMASHAFGAVQDIIPDRQGGLSSIATVIGARATVWLCIWLYLAATALVASGGDPSDYVVASVGLLYAANAWPYRQIDDASSAIINRAWRRFIWLNFIAGAVVTMALIYNHSF